MMIRNARAIHNAEQAAAMDRDAAEAHAAWMATEGRLWTLLPGGDYQAILEMLRKSFGDPPRRTCGHIEGPFSPSWYAMDHPQELVCLSCIQARHFGGHCWACGGWNATTAFTFAIPLFDATTGAVTGAPINVLTRMCDDCSHQPNATQEDQ